MTQVKDILNCLHRFPKYILKLLHFINNKILVNKNHKNLTKSGVFFWDISLILKALGTEVKVLFTACSLGARSLHEHAPRGLRPSYVSFLGGLAEALR